MNEKDEEKIQELIRERVLEEYKKRQLKEEAKLQSEANIEALHDVTEIPKEDIQKIADEVRAEFGEADKTKPPLPGKSKNIKSYLPYIIAIVLLGLLLTRTPLFQRYFTTGVSPLRRPALEHRMMNMEDEDEEISERRKGRQKSKRKSRRR